MLNGPLQQGGGTMKATNRDRKALPVASPQASIALWIAIGLSLVVLALHFFVDGEAPVASRITGVVAGLFALVFMFLPVLTLKRHGAVVEGGTYMHTTRVVDRGLFAIVRHPQYIGYGLFNVTFVLLNGHWSMVVVAAAALLAFFAHTFAEERYLLSVHGEAYLAYQRRVPRINVLVGIVRLFLLRKPPG